MTDKMIDLNETNIDKLIFHHISNDESFIAASDEAYEFKGDNEEAILKNIFLKSFLKSTSTYEFKHDIDIELNPLFKLAQSIYNGSDFVEMSKNILTHLKNTSRHPNIKDGELFVVKFSDIKFENTFYEALGVYKIENKDDYIQTSHTDVNYMSLSKGINGRRLDKSCLVLFSKTPYTVLIVENANKDTEYWTNEFLNVAHKNDFVNNTNNFMLLARSFITTELPEKFDVSKADQVELLNKSVKFFKEKETFDIEEFANEVIAQPEVFDSFNQYKDSYAKERDIEFADSFSISDSAVKKQARAFKSVIKLDKNFHIYIHGDRQLIEQGEDNKGKFYKVYYKEEQ